MFPALALATLAHLPPQADTGDGTHRIAMPKMDWVAIGPMTILIGGALLLLLFRSIVRPRVALTTAALAGLIVGGVVSLGAFAWTIHEWLADPGKAGFSAPE